MLPCGLRSGRPTDAASPEGQMNASCRRRWTPSRPRALRSSRSADHEADQHRRRRRRWRWRRRRRLQQQETSEDVEAAVTQHLIRGNRESALEAAIGGKAWALALVIASVCGADKYKEVVRLFADNDLTHGTPAHTLALVFSGQAEAAVKLAGAPSSKTAALAARPAKPWRRRRRSSGGGSGAAGGGWLVGERGDNTAAAVVLLDQWRYNLAGLLATARAAGEPGGAAG